MPDYSPLITALSTKVMIWVEVEGEPVEGVRITQDFLLPDSVRAPLAEALAALPATPAPSPTAPDEDMVAVDVINIRSTPNQSLPNIGTIQKGDKVTVSGTFYDPVSKVDYTLVKSINGLKQTVPAYTGRKWLVLYAPTPMPPPSPQPPQFDIVTRYVNASAGLNRHTQPNVQSEVIKPGLVYGAKVEIDANSIANGYVKLIGQDGWVNAQYLQPFASAPSVPKPSGWTPVSYPRHTLHYIAGGNWNNVAGWLKQRKDMGKPVPGLLLCSMGWSGEPLPENAIAAGAMEVIWRDYPGGSPWGNWADTTGSYQAGFDHVAHCRLPGGSLDKTFIQIQNESTSVGPGLANFYHGAFDAAQLRGIKIAYPVFSVGFPPLDFWAGFVDVLRRGRDEGHRFTLHQYRAFWDQDGEVGTDKQAFINTLLNPDICLRHQKIFAALPADLKHEPVVLAEFFSRVATRIPLDWYRDGVKALNAALANDPNLAWAAHWTYGHGGDRDWEVSEVYDEKAAALFEA